MSKKKSIEGHCALCGKYKSLSFEHVPPSSAFNDKPIFIQNHEHLVETTSHVYGKKMKSNRGFGGYTLCEECNNNTGSWYANDFVEFAKQGMEIIKSTELRYTISGVYKIKPLNVIKQIFTMFMSADKSGYLRAQTDLVDFILDKNSVEIPDKFRIHIYSTLSPMKRMMGYSVVHAPGLGVQKWSEINFQPFGYLLADQSQAAHKHMCDITSFSQFNYDEETSVKLTTAYLNVDSPWIGTYK